MKTLRSPWLFFLIVFLLPASAFALAKFYEIRFEKLPVLVAPDHKIASFRLRNQSGREVCSDEWKGRILIANFFFTHCSSVCPKMMYGLKRVQAYAKVPGLQIVSITVDPERDTVGRMKAYADGQEISGNWQLLTGDKRTIYSLARNSFRVSATDGDGGPDDFIHSEQLVLIDKSGRIRGFYKGTDEQEVNALARDAEKLATER